LAYSNIRSKVQQNTNQSILRLEGVNDSQAASYYFGKRVVYIYKTTTGQKDRRFRVYISLISRLSGVESQELTEIQEPFLPDLLIIYHQEQLAQLLELCYSHKEIDLI